MTIKQLFDYVDEVKPNAFSPQTKIVWLNEVEGLVQTEIYLLSPSEVFEYKWDVDVVMTTITIPAYNTIGVVNREDIGGFRPGASILEFAPGGSYADDAADELVIKDITDAGIIVSGVFPVTGDEEVTTALQYTDANCELLVEPPHSKLYAEYIMARIDYAHGEYDKYQSSMQMFNSFWSEFSAWFARMYRPADRKERW